MDELEFIRSIKKKFSNEWENKVGNDSAVFQVGHKKYLITKDILVEGTHFYPDIPVEALAYKSLMVNISDILSDGGTPVFFIIGIGAAKAYQNKITQLYEYYHQYCNAWNIPIIGGDTVSSPTFFISITCVGKALSNIWLRKNAKINDDLYLTGEIGASSYGLYKIKEKGHDLIDPDIKKHLFPPYRYRAVRFLKRKVHAAIDISDGLILDLYKILEESGKGAILYEDAIPFADSLPTDKKEEFGFYGGEDYEILFTSNSTINLNKYFKSTGTPLYRIGKIINEKENIYLQKTDKSILLINRDKNKGYDHWKE